MHDEEPNASTIVAAFTVAALVTCALAIVPPTWPFPVAVVVWIILGLVFTSTEFVKRPGGGDPPDE